MRVMVHYSSSCDIDEPRDLARAATAGPRRHGFVNNDIGDLARRARVL